MNLNGNVGVALKSVGIGFTFAFVSYLLSGSDASIPIGILSGYISYGKNHTIKTKIEKKPKPKEIKPEDYKIETF